MIKQFAKLLIIASAVGIAAMPAMSVAKSKTPTCTQEAKKAGIKGKAEIKKYVHECAEKRKQAKKAMTEQKKMEEKK